MNKNRKQYKDYADRLIIADASPLINLNNLNKMDYLKNLFSEVYTTKTVKNECNFELPEWIKIEEPQAVTKKLLSHKGMDDGEKSAIDLAYEKNIMQEFGYLDKKSCLILDDKRAKKIRD